MAFAGFNSALTIVRPGAGAYVSGVWVPGATGNIGIQGSIQPASGKDLQLLPEGRRVEAAYAVYTVSQVLLGDRTTIQGEAYEALAVQPWQNGVLPHYKAVFTKMQAVNT